MSVRPWSQVTAQDGWSDLSETQQAYVRDKWLTNEVGPALADDPDRNAILASLASDPIDSGQGYTQSLVNSAARVLLPTSPAASATQAKPSASPVAKLSPNSPMRLGRVCIISSQ